jgi:hypothetical protein
MVIFINANPNSLLRMFHNAPAKVEVWGRTSSIPLSKWGLCTRLNFWTAVIDLSFIKFDVYKHIPSQVQSLLPAFCWIGVMLLEFYLEISWNTNERLWPQDGREHITGGIDNLRMRILFNVIG